ncbi:PLDc N-terminal domain-containing protein [Specibacter cremeus]|uniref:PLDc N-terminal domain-containing protein n=1 Tax=Specibacter cremeus TaxID=1629051 RepID=UPI000F7B23BA|nr:PLDc N-terminal domain-containing protein [Specibacter cremeus]
MRYIPVVFLVVVYIYGLIDCLRSDPRDVRSVPKPVWLVVVILLPVIGDVLWFFLGRPQYDTAPAAPSGAVSRGPVAPDDDPAFLRNLESSRKNQAEAARLRKLKDELEAREAAVRRKLHGEHGSQHPNDESTK